VLHRRRPKRALLSVPASAAEWRITAHCAVHFSCSIDRAPSLISLNLGAFGRSSRPAKGGSCRYQ
jgi:hypothetical protein